MLRKMTREQFGLRLLCYHGGGGTATYALGSFIVAGVPIHKSLIEACRDEMIEEASPRVGASQKFYWLACAMFILADVLDQWMRTGTPPWEVPHG